MSNVDRNAPPIFIVGSPRSGTTLFREILNRHPSLAICDETHFFPLVYNRRKFFGDLADAGNRQRLIQGYLATRHIKRAGIDSPQLAERLAREGINYKALFASILTYNAELRGKPRFGEKTPRHALFLGTLYEWFPDALIIHMVRDPRAAVASMRRRGWVFGNVVVNARRWLKMNQAARKFRDHPGYLEVRYEALVTDPENELRKICSFVGEEYSPSMLVPEDGLTPDVARERKEVTDGRLDVWRNELNAQQVAQIEWVLGPHLESFGYARESSPASALTVLRGVGSAALANTRFKIVRLPATWYRRFAPTKFTRYDYWQGP